MVIENNKPSLVNVMEQSIMSRVLQFKIIVVEDLRYKKMIVELFDFIKILA